MREPAMKPIRIVSAAQRSYDRALSCDWFMRALHNRKRPAVISFRNKQIRYTRGVS